MLLSVFFFADILSSSVSGYLAPFRAPSYGSRGLRVRQDSTAQTQLFNLTGLDAGLSSACLEAMQTPVSCSSESMELLLSSQGQAGGNGAAPVVLTADDLTDLCTTSCTESLATMHDAMASACSSAVLAAPTSNSTVYLPGTDAQESIFGGDNATSYQLSLALDLVILRYNLGCMNDTIATDVSWCLLRFDQALTQECDTCELGAYRVQMEEAPGEYDEELAAQYTARVSSCGVSLTPLATPTSTGGGYATSPTATAASVACAEGTMVAVSADETCDDFARRNGVSTAQLLTLNGLTAGCVGFPGNRSELCVQGACNTYTVQANDTCTSVIAAAGISAVQFLSWNPMLGSRGCNADLARQVGHVVCIGNPLPYATPSGATGGISTSTSTTTAAPSAMDPYEDLTSIWTHDPLPTSASTTTATGATPWQTPSYSLAPGSLFDCYFMYDNALANFSCTAIAARYGVSEEMWVSWNPSVQKEGNGTQDRGTIWTQFQGPDCYLDAGRRYCGLLWNPLLASAQNDSDARPYADKPADATAGATDKCYIWDKTPAESMDNLCQLFLDSEGITIAQLYAWNPAVGKSVLDARQIYVIFLQLAWFLAYLTDVCKKALTARISGWIPRTACQLMIQPMTQLPPRRK